MNSTLKSASNAAQQELYRPSAPRLNPEVQAFISRNWNAYFSATERVTSAQAQQISFEVGPQGVALTAAFRFRSVEHATAVTRELNLGALVLRWDLERISMPYRGNGNEERYSGQWRARAF